MLICGYIVRIFQAAGRKTLWVNLFGLAAFTELSDEVSNQTDLLFENQHWKGH